ncbi:MAG: hypothetical protein MUP44_11125, partial [Anaerolineales bacterium]|nr:hypothetical protein [Anaerolineales bacterium]
VSMLKKGFKSPDVWTWRVTDYNAGSQVDHLRPISNHLFTGIFNIATRTAVTSGVPNQFDFSVRIDTECSFPILYGAETFSPRTSTVSIANNNADICF